MSFPKKKSRKIIVDDRSYLWIARGNNQNPGYINLSIFEEPNGPKIFAKFDYNSTNPDASWLVDPFIVTPSVVRKTILYATQHGYIPGKKEKDLRLGNLSKIIDLSNQE